MTWSMAGSERDRIQRMPFPSQVNQMISEPSSLRHYSSMLFKQNTPSTGQDAPTPSEANQSTTTPAAIHPGVYLPQRFPSRRSLVILIDHHIDRRHIDESKVSQICPITPPTEYSSPRPQEQ